MRVVRMSKPSLAGAPSASPIKPPRAASIILEPIVEASRHHHMRIDKKHQPLRVKLRAISACAKFAPARGGGSARRGNQAYMPHLVVSGGN